MNSKGRPSQKGKAFVRLREVRHGAGFSYLGRNMKKRTYTQKNDTVLSAEALYQHVHIQFHIATHKMYDMYTLNYAHLILLDNIYILLEII